METKPNLSSKTAEILHFIFIAVPVFLVVFTSVQTFFLIKSIIKWITKK